MPFNGSGTYAAPASSFNPAVATTTISSTDWAALLADLTTALSTAICKDGQSTPTANIPMGGFKFTGLGAGTGAGNSVRYEQVLLLAGGTMVGDILFTDATYDIGKVGATRPRDLFMSRNLTVGGTAAITGHVTLEGVTSTGAQGSGALVFATSPTLTTAALGSSTATTQTAGDNSTKVATTAYVDGSIGLVKLNSGSVSAAATLDIVMTSYTAYAHKLVVFDLIPATDAQGLRIRVSTDGGSNYDSGAGNYSYAGTYVDDNGTTAVQNLSSDTEILISQNTSVGNGATEGVSGQLFLPNTTSTAKWLRVDVNCAFIDSSATPRVASFRGTGTRRAAQDTDAIRFYFGSGNIASGTWKLYGYN